MLLRNTLALILCTLLFASFTTPVETCTHKTRYVYVVATERDKKLDERTENGYVDLSTEIVSYSCSHGRSEVERQFMEHYAAEEKTSTRNLEYNFPVSAWVYDSYDEAVASRRDWLSKSTAKHKRRIERFYVTCN